MQIKRVVVPIDSQDSEAWNVALAHAKKIGEAASPSVKSYVLLTHTKQQLKQTVLEDHIGQSVSKALLAKKSVALADGQLHYETLQTLGLTGRGSVIIAYFADDKMLETIDGLSQVAGVVAVPDLSGQVDKWIDRWNPEVHGQVQPAVAAPLINDPVIVNALTSIERWINISHGAINTRDKGYADETLRILRSKGHQLEPEQIKSWAIRNKWNSGSANDLAKLATKIRDLKAKPSLSGFRDPDGKYQRWNE